MIGLLLLATCWLPANFLGGDQKLDSRSHIRIHTQDSAQSDYSTATHSQPVLHQLRGSAPRLWFGKISGGVPNRTGIVSKRPDIGTQERWVVTSAPSELLHTWQFTRRTAP